MMQMNHGAYELARRVADGAIPDPESADWQALVAMTWRQVGAEIGERAYEELYHAIDEAEVASGGQRPMGVLDAAERVYSTAGFLVGLEMGRRLGWAR